MMEAAAPLAVSEVIDLFTNPGTLGGVLIDGAAKAGVYVMIASGLTLIFGLMDVINFAHGAFTMIGAYIAGGLMLALAAEGMGVLPILGVFLLVMFITFLIFVVFGAITELTLIRKLYEYGAIFQILLTFGITIALEEFMRMMIEFTDVNQGDYRHDWGTPMDATRPSTLGSGGVDFGLFTINGLHLLQIVLGVFTVVTIWAFLTKTRYGLFVRAGVQDEEMAEALGVNVKQTFTVVFAVGSGLAGAAGALLMWDPLWATSVPLGLEVLLPAFVIVIVGGLGSFKGTVYASILVGYIDAVETWAFRRGVIEFAGADALMIFLILVVMLIIKPQGLFGIEVEHG